MAITVSDPVNVTASGRSDLVLEEIGRKDAMLLRSVDESRNEMVCDSRNDRAAIRCMRLKCGRVNIPFVSVLVK